MNKQKNNFSFSFFQLIAFLVFSYPITYKYTVGVKSYFILAALFTLYSFVVEYIMTKKETVKLKKILIVLYMPALIALIVFFIVFHYVN